MAERSEMHLRVVGDRTLHCAGCERTVEFTLTRLAGVESARADHHEQSIEVVVTGPDTGLDQIRESLDWIGYEVERA